ncbi:MAG: hypothetical protein Q9227_007845 [Pyrenula ochraceoflavens]
MAVRIADTSTLDFEPDYHVKSPSKSSMWQRLGLRKLFTRDGEKCEQPTSPWDLESRLALRRTGSRKVGVGLPRPPTFKRQNSERREHLEPVKPCAEEKRAFSLTRQRALSLHRPRSSSTPPPIPGPRVSAPAVTHSNDFPELSHASTAPEYTETSSQLSEHEDGNLKPVPSQTFSDSRPPSDSGREDGDALNTELDNKWILNLSMHFRDKSDREKFFVTYAEERNRWRRVTVSCDYRGAEPESLEMDLKELQFQRDKSAQIYESIRDSLTEIQFYDTVTNLKLETTEGRLHVHVTEDVNEIIPYPPIASVSHLREARLIRESEIAFDSHLSGFVYKVKFQGQDFIKKEIPGPDTVDEFLYEINALYAINGSNSVIDFKGIIVDDKQKVVKGLLIDFAEQGALVDLIYDHKGELSLDRRLRWARQAVEGLNKVHEAGFVQGDFTLSNIVIDRNNDAKIIDINRRGCPVGWEPPEIAAKIKSNQRISMYIGVKSDLYQLGMTLWAIAAQEDEPERCDEPLLTYNPLSDFPQWYRSVVHICLSESPQQRLSARDLLSIFPKEQPRDSACAEFSSSRSRVREREYIEPSAAVEREDLERFKREDYSNDGTLIQAPSTTYACESSSSTIEFSKTRQRSPERGRRRSRDDEIEVYLDSDTEPQIIPISPDTDHEEIILDGHPYLVSRSTFSPEDLKVLEESETNIQSSVSEKAPLDFPRNQSHSSQSTPRNQPSISQAPDLPSLDIATQDLAGFGGNPALGEESPHEPCVFNQVVQENTPPERNNSPNKYYAQQGQSPHNSLERKTSPKDDHSLQGHPPHNPLERNNTPNDDHSQQGHPPHNSPERKTSSTDNDAQQGQSPPHSQDDTPSGSADVPIIAIESPTSPPTTDIGPNDSINDG